MARKIIDTGVVGNDGTGDSIRDSFRKVNDNFRELYSSLGLGERLSFTGLDDTPDSFVGQNNQSTGATPIVTVNNTESGLAFKQLVPGNGISIDFTSNPNEITINSDFAEIAADESPQLGGNLSARSGGNQWRIKDLVTPITQDEAANKFYADTKLSRAGTNAIDPATNRNDPSFGRMSGPLILSRDPEPDDDELYGGLIAATKRYVDNSSFGSVANLYVATSGADDRPGVSADLQGRALAYAYRTVEAALKRAEELVNEARLELGPYQKTLTYQAGANEATLSSITSSPDSGTGFDADALVSVDTVTINTPGINYYVGDILELSGGTILVGGQKATIEVLTTATTPGAILTFRILSTGVYSAIPGSTAVSASIITSAAPSGIGAIGATASFNVTYKVNNVIINNPGSGYSLVSVRITGSGGTGSFGTAEVEAVSGAILGVTVTDPGSGFTGIPTVIADLPRFSIYTAGYRTDFTGDVLTDTPTAFRGRDIREGLYLKGLTSGALAQILAHQGELDSNGNELFDVDIKYGSFQLGEAIAYGDVSKNIQISILVESGEYYENYPLKVPQNCSIVGDEFRRVIIRPRDGTSSSPWAFQKFRRDITMDGLATANQLFGYHYLQDSSQPVYPKIDNKGDYRSAAALLALNRSWISEEVIAWINDQISNNYAPFTRSFEYDEDQWKRNSGLIIDSIIYDLKYGGYDRSISAGLKYYESADSRLLITTYLLLTIATINRINFLAQYAISNTSPTTEYQNLYPQIIDAAYIAESGSSQVITDLITAIEDVLDGSGSVNYPKENNQMDVFLANDAVRWQAISCQGHGGFMLVLDPAGQILAKSPYAQECASFSRSIDAQTFAGGMFVDGFSGNLQFKMVSKDSNTRIRVGGLDRYPNLPCSFIISDVVYRVNYVRDFVYNKAGSTATFILDETTPYPFPVFTYNPTICARDVGYIVGGLGYDIVFGTNYNARKAGLTYRQANAEVVVQTQKDLTVRAIAYAHTLASQSIGGYTTQQLDVDSSSSTLTRIVDLGSFYAPSLTLTNPPGLDSALANAKELLALNINFIKDEVVGYVNTVYSSVVYDPLTCARDVQYIIEATMYDLIYGGNQMTRDAGLKYYDGVGDAISLQIGALEKTATFNAINWAKYVAKQVIVNAAPSTIYSTTARQTGSASDSTTQGIIDTLIGSIATIVDSGVGSAPALTMPSTSAYAYDSNDVAVKGLLDAAITGIQSQTITFVNDNANLWELLMPGNRSMLCNDFTQINDLGYGIFATNSGLVEAVSMFTYYCHISYYSLNGAQIRSVGGSSAHGNYALVAQGSDPLEVPTPTTMFGDLAQAVTCYYPSPSYANVTNGLLIYITAYDYPPLNNSELEVDHGGGIMYRYPITSVSTEGLPAGVARLNLTSDSTGNFDGLYASIADGTKMSLRNNSQVILTGTLAEVATRPSTGLVLTESEDVYRVLQFEDWTDPNGPFGIVVTPGTPGTFRVTATVTTIASDVCTTSQNHSLRIGDLFIPISTANGFSANATYYIIEVPEYNKFKVSTTPSGTSATLTNGTGLSIKGYKTHKLLEGYSVEFSSSDTLPGGLTANGIYWVLSDGLGNTTFRISEVRGGSALEITSAGTGNQFYSMTGLTKTTLRENYNYVNLTVYQPGEFTSDYPTGRTATISVAVPAVITLASHGFSAGDVIRFTTTGALPTGLNANTHYHVLSAGLGAGSFRVSTSPGGTAIDTSGSQSGVHKVGKVTGRAGDSSFVVVGLSPADTLRADGSKFVFRGEEYIINNYENEADTNQPYGRVTLNRPLVDSIQAYGSSYTINAAVPIRSLGAAGALTIRISLTRVTSHDLLEIGSGSYADTNYPNEIYGPGVNALNADNETVERDVGRTFYVTTDQYGNFSVGPYFRVDQGTGQVTFSAAIALSNLDGLGFKRGVPISEFSTDSGFSDNATDTVPTENAARIYIERRLGVTHSGSTVTPGDRIPTVTGGFMALSGQIPMGGALDMGNNKLLQLKDPTSAQDGVNLRSLIWNNFQDFTPLNVQANDLLVFTGSGNQSYNASIVGDISLNIDSTAHTLDAQINPQVVVNADINNSAAIEQYKLALDNAYATTGASLTSVTATRSTSTVTLSHAAGLTTAPFAVGQRIVVSGFSTALYNGTFTVITSTTSATTYNITLGTNAYAAGLPSWTLPVTPAVGSATVTALRGISTYDTTQFTVTNGYVTVKDNGLPITKIAQIASQRVLGNSTLGTANVTEVGFSTVVADGGAVKKSQYGTGTGFLRRTNSTGGAFTNDTDFGIVDMSTGSATSVGASSLIYRDSNGDFGGRIADLASLKIDGSTALDSATTATGAYMKLYGGAATFAGQGGITIQSGSLAADKTTYYDNDSHSFRTQNGLSAAPIVASSIQVSTLTAGGNTSPGTITGRWTLSGTSPNESRLQATYSADLAENYEGDKDYEVGTVLVFGGDKEVTTTNTKNDTRVAGVVSNTAAYTMYEACPGFKNLVALQGRVPCKVVGKIKKGDILVTSGIPGVATVAVGDVKVGTVVGKALKDYDSDHIGTLEIAVGRT
jgi:hypothetical protein